MMKRKLLISFLSVFFQDLETSIEGSEFIFDSFQLMYYRCYKVNLRCRRSYIHSPEWLRKEKTTIFNIR